MSPTVRISGTAGPAEGGHYIDLDVLAALYALELDRFSAVVIIDKAGRNFHEESRAKWRRAR